MISLANLLANLLANHLQPQIRAITILLLKVTKTMDRARLWTVQTPQTVKTELLKKAFEAVRKKGATVTDEASAVELISEEVRLVEVTGPNIKITTSDDLPVAVALLKLERSHTSP